MQRLRSLRQKTRYTQLANDAIDRLPSLESVGLLATILRHDDAFDFDMALLIKRKSNVGKKGAYKARRELIEHGYLVQIKFKHTHRGRFGTDIYRAAEPHTADDLDELRNRYTPGEQITINDNGSDRIETVVWAEMTSSAGTELLGASSVTTDEFSTELDESSVKPQVAPDAGRVESGQGESGGVESPHAAPFKEDCPVEDEQEPPPSVPTADTQPAETEQAQEVGEDVSTEIWDMLASIPIPAGKRAPGRRSRKLADVAARCAAILAAPDHYGLSLRNLDTHLRADLDTVRHSITAVWLHRLADSELPSPSQLRKPDPAPSLPPVCGQCQARDGEGRPERVVYVQRANGKGDYTYKCPQCHPDVQTNHHAKQQETANVTASETDVGETIEQMLAGASLGAAPND